MTLNRHSHCKNVPRALWFVLFLCFCCLTVPVHAQQRSGGVVRVRASEWNVRCSPLSEQTGRSLF